jgi:hypothetical protein
MILEPHDRDTRGESERGKQNWRESLFFRTFTLLGLQQSPISASSFRIYILGVLRSLGTGSRTYGFSKRCRLQVMGAPVRAGLSLPCGSLQYRKEIQNSRARPLPCPSMRVVLTVANFILLVPTYWHLPPPPSPHPHRCQVSLLGTEWANFRRRSSRSKLFDDRPCSACQKLAFIYR